MQTPTPTPTRTRTHHSLHPPLESGGGWPKNLTPIFWGLGNFEKLGGGWGLRGGLIFQGGAGHFHIDEVTFYNFFKC